MTSFTHESLASGRPLSVTAVAGQSTDDLGALSGEAETTFTVDNDGSPYEVQGAGAPEGDAVRFYEKDNGAAGRDVRVWLVERAADGGLVASTVSCY
jgi:hypothetical protein